MMGSLFVDLTCLEISNYRQPWLFVVMRLMATASGQACLPIGSIGLTDTAALRCWCSQRSALASCSTHKTGRVQVTDSIGQLTRLTSLTLVECPLEELRSSISCLQNLRHLDLDTSYLQEVKHLSTQHQSYSHTACLMAQTLHQMHSTYINVS